MKIILSHLVVILLSGLLVSCASSTMDSIPTLAQLEAYERVILSRHQGLYDDLERQRASGAISKTEYGERRRQLDSKVTEEVNDVAWRNHSLAESERKVDGVPTPDAPVRLNPGGSSGESFHRPANQNFGNVAGVSGTAGMSSVSSASEQFQRAQSVRNDAISAGGSFLSAPPPGSIYDTTVKR
ncbi:MAG: hypothetical protein ACKVY0_29910 [Prosthecobacter sp.]|uniref:hypothetical protein n=1 Tax=Prosthecobacter sp. TaxID=1965333 RepID=UPI0038FD50C2